MNNHEVFCTTINPTGTSLKLPWWVATSTSLCGSQLCWVTKTIPVHNKRAKSLRVSGGTMTYNITNNTPLTITLICNKAASKIWLCNRKDTARRRGSKGFVWMLPKGNGKDRWKIIWEGCLIWSGRGKARVEGCFFHCQRERLNQIN